MMARMVSRSLRSLGDGFVIFIVNVEGAHLHLKHLGIDAQAYFETYFVVGIKSINSVLHLPNEIGRTEIKSIYVKCVHRGLNSKFVFDDSFLQTFV
jgi:hypothetical protein